MNASDSIVCIHKPFANTVPEDSALLAVVELPVMNTCAARVTSIYWVIITIRKHITADDSLTGGGVGVGVDEAAQLGIVVAGLEVIEPGVSTVKCPIRPF